MQQKSPHNNPHVNRELTLFYLREYNNITNSNYSDLDYIHNCRSKVGVNNPEILADRKVDYYNQRQNCLTKVGEYFRGKKYNAIVYAPSCTNMHLPFFVEVIKVIEFGTIIEFSKSKSAGKYKRFKSFYKHFKLETPVDQIKRNLGSIGSDDLEIKKLLILDDMYADGKTVGAIINKLGEYHVKVNEINVFTPLIRGESTPKIDLSDVLLRLKNDIHLN